MGVRWTPPVGRNPTPDVGLWTLVLEEEQWVYSTCRDARRKGRDSGRVDVADD